MLKLEGSGGQDAWDLTNAILPTVSSGQGLSGSGLSFHGFPIVVMPNGILINGYDSGPHASTPFAIFGNLRTAGCWPGQNGGMDVRTSFDATADGVNAFTNDLQMLRMTERIAFGIGQPSYIGVLSTSARLKRTRRNSEGADEESVPLDEAIEFEDQFIL